MELLLLLIGFALLLYGGDLLVRGGVGLADRYRVSPLVVGLTIVSFGTSAPELFASIQAGITGHPDIAIGNVIGSNIANIALVLALTAIIFPIPVRKNSVRIDAPFMLLVSLLLLAFLSDLYLARWECLLFVALIVGYTYGLFYYSRKRHLHENDFNPKEHLGLLRIVVFLVLSIILLAAGSYLLVGSASKIALRLGVPERIIAVTIVAFGTSLPELVTSLIAAFKKQMDISIGNIIGSNIFNILAVLGITGSIVPMKVDPGFLKDDMPWMLAVSFLLLLFILPFKGGILTRWKGAVLGVLYGVYVYILYFRTV